MALDAALGALASIPKGIGKADLQFGIVVRDLDAAMAQWSALLGCGPWVVINQFPGYSFFHRGQQSDVKFTVAFAYWGDIQIELIRQDNDAASPYKEFIDSGREGLQHFGVFVRDYAGARAALEGAGMETIYVIKTGHPNDTIYYGAPAAVGPMIELVELHDLRVKSFGAIRKICESTGGPTVRRYGAFADIVADAEKMG